MDSVRHVFQGFPFAKVVPKEDPVRVLVDGKIKDSDEVYGGIIIDTFPGLHLFLDGERRIVQGPFIEEILVGQLHLDDKASTIGIRAFHIHADSLVVRERVDMLLRSVFQIGNLPFRNQFL